jgi:hypothetical protein
MCRVVRACRAIFIATYAMNTSVIVAAIKSCTHACLLEIQHIARKHWTTFDERQSDTVFCVSYPCGANDRFPFSFPTPPLYQLLNRMTRFYHAGELGDFFSVWVFHFISSPFKALSIISHAIPNNAHATTTYKTFSHRSTMYIP